MEFGCTLTRRGIAARQHESQGYAAAAHRLDHEAVALTDALLRERQLPIPIAGGHVDAGEIEHEVGIRRVEHLRQMPPQHIQVLGVAYPVPQRHIQIGPHLR
jgi:hypothetical protein